MKELEKNYNPADIEAACTRSGWTASISTQTQSAAEERERSRSPL